MVGFGSSDGSPGQAAAITRCLPTKVDSGQSRDALVPVHRRCSCAQAERGSHTDHVAALRQALSFLSDGTQAVKIVFLLTDGNLDVQDSPAYGRDLGPEARDKRPGTRSPACSRIFESSVRRSGFQLSLTGSSGVTEQAAGLTDDDRDGTFTTRLRVPATASGNLTFTGTVTGVGVGGDTRVFATTVGPRPADLQGQLRLTGTDSTVAPGGSVPGKASIDNKSGRERTLRLQLAPTRNPWSWG